MVLFYTWGWLCPNNIYDIDGTEYKFVHNYTTSGGEQSNWYEKSINNQEIECEDEKIIGIFNKFYNLEVDTGRALRLMFKNKKIITEYDEKQFEYNPNVIYFGRYRQPLIALYTKPIEWLVLYKDNTKALLLSRYILEWKQVDSNNISNWANSELNLFLQNVFLIRLFQIKKKAP